MEKKFELTDEFIINDLGIKLYRIKALKDFSDVKKGDFGGGTYNEKGTYPNWGRLGFMIMQKFLTKLVFTGMLVFTVIQDFSGMLLSQESRYMI